VGDRELAELRQEAGRDRDQLVGFALTSRRERRQLDVGVDDDGPPLSLVA
jgi:hypothetical protein